MHRRNLTFALLIILLWWIPAHSQKVLKEKFKSDNTQRSYYLFVPDSVKAAQSAPVLVLLHGSGRNGLSLVEKWQELAKREGLIIVGPDSKNSQMWRAPDDGPEFLRDLIEALKTKHSINARRVYLFGHSGGAVFALNMSMMESEYFAATAVHAGSWREPKEFSIVEDAKRRIPVAIFVGDRDAFFPLDSVRATEKSLKERAFPVEVNVMSGHTHWYYDRASEINRNAWEFLKKHELARDPRFEEYDSAGAIDDANAAINELNALRQKANEAMRQFYVKEDELQSLNYARGNAAVDDAARAQVALLVESGKAFQQASVKAEAISKLLRSTQSQYFSLVAQIERKRSEGADLMRHRAQLLLSDEPGDSIIRKRNEDATRVQDLQKQIGALEQEAERVRAGKVP